MKYVEASEANIAKLPRWAQSYIASLIAERDRARMRASEFTADPSHRPGDVTLTAYAMRGEAERSLPRFEHVYFWLGDENYVEVSHERFQTSQPGSFVRVRTNHGLVIEPEVSNSVKVRSEEWRKRNPA